MPKHSIYIALPLVALALSACDGSVYYYGTQPVDEHHWAQTEALDFNMAADDTVHLFDYLIEVRNTTNYPYANLFLFVDTQFPDGSLAHDTIECPLADATGRWYGKRTGRYVSSRFRLRQHSARLPMQGNYHFSIRNAMRDSITTGIKDVGIRIEYSKTTQQK